MLQAANAPVAGAGRWGRCCSDDGGGDGAVLGARCSAL